jgi:hypothetical protein
MRAFACAAIALVTIAVSGPTAFGQAGSTGGTLGNTDKSISGDREQPREAPTHPRERAKRASGAVSISGKWSWECDCDTASGYRGQFALEQDPDGTIKGTCGGGAECGAISGQIVGNKAVLTLQYPGAQNVARFTVSDGGQTMRGTEDTPHHGVCRYVAKRS